ncbi:acyl-CoA synthetase [Sphingobium chlorophenolicum]|uniref:O-succinylbenzoate--CoA ligase n=1 Tax=Sphingobium chlorophenolicum TaxID=46429 RepID=A0A081RDY7_SPHCR|nr:acyl-CoA synthetase [Sphingobium chlorophenolicum]KEQ53410.1 O-succinylbenzoate--CoA ligase [Sphingobium chlorophenolicum]
MTHPFISARATPEKPAIILAQSGKTLNYAQLEARANQTAHLFRSLGLKRGDCVAAILENGLDIFIFLWAAQRAGLYFTTLSTRLTAAESEYIIRDSGAGALFLSAYAGTVAEELAAIFPDLPKYMAGAHDGSCASWDDAASAFPETPIADESVGGPMLYSSGTTGRPKGVKRALSEGTLLDLPPMAALFTTLYGGSGDSVFLCPAPLYHAAPQAWAMLVHQFGGTVVVMERFDAEDVLKAIERHGVTVAQFVPTHFIRLLNLPEEVRARYDLSSLRTAFHAAAPCPIPVKEAMMQWWGAIIHEYYAGTEGNGMTAIDPQQWLNHKGSVGRPIGCEVHICDEDGEPLTAHQVGQVYFSGGLRFEYHNDPEKTQESRNSHGWSSMGDVGYVDEEGYLYLTDRKSFMIISGGVNVYPQEVENLIQTHPKVADVAVIGAPDPDLGERVVAVIQTNDPRDAGPELADELRQFVRATLSGVKVPKQYDFVEELPRHPTGKLYKRLVRDRYWPK